MLTECGEPFADFVAGGELSAIVQDQQKLYEALDSRYAVQLESDSAFIQRFVADFAAGRVKNKEAVLRAALLDLSLGPQSVALEVGCNDGRFLNALCTLTGCSGAGVDLSQRAIRRAIALRPKNVATDLAVAQASALPFADASFDAVFSFDVLEHLGHDGVRDALKECRRVLRPGGALLVYVVSRKDQFTLHDTVRAASKGLWGTDSDEGHDRPNFLTPDEFRQYAGQAGFRVTALKAHHAFWTLFAEEYLGNRLPAAAYSVLAALDYPLLKNEHGNGFIAKAELST